MHVRFFEHLVAANLFCPRLTIRIFSATTLHFTVYILFVFSICNTTHLFKIKWSGIWTLGQKTWWLWGLLIAVWCVVFCPGLSSLLHYVFRVLPCLWGRAVKIIHGCDTAYTVYSIYIIWYTYRYSIEACYIQMRSASMCSARYICVGSSVISVETRLPYWCHVGSARPALMASHSGGGDVPGD